MPKPSKSNYLALTVLSFIVTFVAAIAETKPINVIVIGGSSGMGKAAALSAIKRGGRAFLVGRTEDKLQHASTHILSSSAPSRKKSNSIETATLDITDESAVESFAATLTANEWDGLVISAAGKAPHGPIGSLSTSLTRDFFDGKFWGAYYCAKHLSPLLREGGSICFVSGVLNRRPGINCTPLACTNGALEGLTRALALELGPRLRVNCLSPGFCDTERFDHMSVERREAMLKNTAESLPLRRVGRPVDMGEAIYYLLTADFCTGVVLDCDGGHGIRQYASVVGDPMRNTK